MACRRSYASSVAARWRRAMFSNHRAVLSTDIRELVPGCGMLEAVARIAADREERQRTGQVAPDPFELQRRRDLTDPAQGGGQIAPDRQTVPWSIREGEAQAVEAVDDLREALRVRSSVVHRLRQAQGGVERDVLALRRQHEHVHLPRLQALGDTDPGRVVRQDDDRLAGSKGRGNELADVIEEAPIVAMDLDRVLVACHS